MTLDSSQTILSNGCSRFSGRHDFSRLVGRTTYQINCSSQSFVGYPHKTSCAQASAPPPRVGAEAAPDHMTGLTSIFEAPWTTTHTLTLSSGRLRSLRAPIAK